MIPSATNLKTKEYSRKVREKVVEKLEAGLCCKTISKDLDILGSTVQLSARLIMWSMGQEDLREYVKTANLPRHACPPKAKG